jgi:hypothetical protein
MGCRISSSKGACFKVRLMHQPNWQILKPRIKWLQAVEDA